MKAKNRSIYAILALAIAYAAFFCLVSHLKYRNFEYTDFDLAIDSNTIWNILHGSFNSSILGIPFLGNHMRLILILIAPFYALVMTPAFLLYIQSLALASTIPIVYIFARKEIKRLRYCLLLTMALIFYPPLINLHLYEFHPVAFTVPLLLLCFYFYRAAKFYLFIACLLIALLCQENICLIAIGFGFYALVDKKNFRSKWVAVPAAIGIIYFLMVIILLMPKLNNNTIQFYRIYSPTARSLPMALLDMLHHPLKTFYRAIRPEKLAFIGNLTAPLAFLSFLSPGNLIPVLPVFAQRMLSLRESESTILFHYQAEFIPFIFVSAIFGIKRLKKLLPNIAGTLTVIMLISFPALSWLSQGFATNLSGGISAAFNRTRLDYEKDRIIAKIKPDASALATFDFLPKLSHRNNIYSLHHVYSGYHTLSDVPYRLPEKPEWILIDTLDRLTFGKNGFYQPGNYSNLQRLIQEDQWHVTENLQSLLVLRKKEKGFNPKDLARHLKTLPEIDGNLFQEGLINTVRLRGFEIKDPDARGVSKLFLYWENISGGKLPDFNVLIKLEFSTGSVETLLAPGSRIYPPQSWPVKGYIQTAHGLPCITPENPASPCAMKATLLHAPSNHSYNVTMEDHNST